MIETVRAQKQLNREEILRLLRKFADETGRPPKQSEQGLEGLAYATKKEFGSWAYALKIAGLQTYETWQRRRTFRGEIRRLLDRNPMTMAQLRQKLSQETQRDYSPSRIMTTVRTCSRVNFIGPNRKKVYFIEGQENLARTRLDETQTIRSRHREEILCLLKTPQTKEQIRQQFREDTSSSFKSVEPVLKDLLRSRQVYKIKFVAHARGTGKYSAFDLFGDLAVKHYYCRFDCPEQVATLILRNIPPKHTDSKGFRCALSHHLRMLLPKNVFILISQEFDRIASDKRTRMLDSQKQQSRLDDFLRELRELERSGFK